MKYKVFSNEEFPYLHYKTEEEEEKEEEEKVQEEEEQEEEKRGGRFEFSRQKVVKINAELLSPSFSPKDLLRTYESRHCWKCQV